MSPNFHNQYSTVQDLCYHSFKEAQRITTHVAVRDSCQSHFPSNPKQNTVLKKKKDVSIQIVWPLLWCFCSSHPHWCRCKYSAPTFSLFALFFLVPFYVSSCFTHPFLPVPFLPINTRSVLSPLIYRLNNLRMVRYVSKNR